MSCTSCGSNSITSCNCNDNCPNKTSDITLFNGNLSYIDVPAGASLNDVLSLMEMYIANGFADVDLSYAIGAGNCLGLAAGTYSYNQVLSAVIDKLCQVAAEAIAAVDTNDVALADIVYPACFSAFTGLTSTDLFNEILQAICDQQAEFIPYAASYDKDDIQKYIPLSILADVISGMVDNSIYVYEHTTVVTSPTLLNITVNPMKAVVNNIPVYRPNSEVFSLSPTKDIYFLLKDDGGINKVEQTIGNPAPSTAGVAYLYKIVTDGSGVVSYSEQFTASPFNAPVLSIPNNYITTAMIADGQVTSVKMADVVVGASVGDSSVVSVTFNNKGQITSASSNMSLSGLADGQVLAYDSLSGGFTNVTPMSSGLNGYIPVAVGSDLGPSSIEELASQLTSSKPIEINVGSPQLNADAGLNVVDGTLVVPRHNAVTASTFSLIDGTMIYVTSTNGTFTSVGFWGVEAGAWVKL